MRGATRQTTISGTETMAKVATRESLDGAELERLVNLALDEARSLCVVDWCVDVHLQGSPLPCR